MSIQQQNFRDILKLYGLHFFIFIQLLILAAELPFEYTKIALVIWTISLFTFYKKMPYLNALTGALSLLITVYVVRQFSFIFSNEMISTLILLLTCTRLVEHDPRNKTRPYFLYLLGLFLSVSKFMFQIDLLYGLYALISFFYYFTLFLTPEFRNNSLTRSNRFLLKVFIYSLPLTIIIFIIFPRLKWDYTQQNPSNYYSRIGETGFSTELKPGMISEINSNQNIVAFRAEFFTNHIVENELYWRGQVLDKFYGMTWKKSIDRKNVIERDEDLDYDQIYDFKVILEPHKKDNLFTLENTHSLISDLKILYSEKNNTFTISTLLEEKMIYTGRFKQNLNLKNDQIIDRNYYLQINRRIDLIDKLVQSLEQQNLKQNKLTSSQKVKILSDYFIKNGFTYSTNLQERESSKIEDFIFKHKVGFCEHYASASAILLRHWNIPTRVVTGYYGGRYNYAGQFWTVYEKDAHAWIEYLNENNNWIRFDLTHVIAPDRNNISQKNVFKMISNSTFVAMITSNLDYINYQWTIFFLEYTRVDYSQLLTLINKYKNEIIIIISIFIIFLFILKYILKRRNKNINWKTNLQIEFHNFFKKYQLDQRPNEPSALWQKRLKQYFSNTPELIDLAFKLYLKNMYGPNANLNDLALLKRTLKKLN